MILASDFDNTLFFEYQYFKDEDIKAIRKFQTHNKFGICSGRPFSGLVKPLEGVFQPDFYIVSAGGALLDKDYHLLYGQTVPFDIISEIYKKYKSETELIVTTLDPYHFYCTHLRPEDKEGDYFIEIGSIDDMKDQDIYSISLVRSTLERAEIIAKEINYQYKEVSAFQNMDSIDIVNKECSKGNAILKLKELLHLDIIAGIGDSYNDISMLEVVDIPFTFHYSPTIIQNKAKYVVNSIAEAINILEREDIK